MKLKDLKEWGGRDLPGPGDEATWDGRSPEGDDEPAMQSVSIDELPQEYMFVDPRAFAQLEDESGIVKYMKTCGFSKVTNDTGHQFVPAIKHALKPMFQVFQSGGAIPIASLDGLADLSETLPEDITITQIQAAAKKWVNLAQVD